MWSCDRPGVTFLNGTVEGSGTSHANGSSTVRLTDGRQIKGSLVLDATGHARRLVEYDKEFNPGFQGAYGIIAGEKYPLRVCMGS